MDKSSGNYAIVGTLNKKITALLNIDLPTTDIYMYPGVKKHIGRKHRGCLKYLDLIPDIVHNPDYVGVNPNEPDSVEFIKILDHNVLLSINLSTETEDKYLYVSSLYTISDSKLQNRINNGRLKKYS